MLCLASIRSDMNKIEALCGRAQPEGVETVPKTVRDDLDCTVCLCIYILILPSINKPSPDSTPLRLLTAPHT